MSDVLYKVSPIAASVVAALQPAGSALAQEDEVTAVDEIIVTANKREGDVMDLDQSIQAVTGADIDKKSILSMEDLISSLPSVTISAAQPGRNTIIARGMTTGTDEWRTDSSVAVYMDEVPMTAISQQVDPRMVDIQRVEMLTGPQGTLFGASSTAGTMRIITNKPDPNETAGGVEANYKTTKGGDDSYDINGYLNVPLSDSMAIRMVAYKADEGGWIDNVAATSLSGTHDNSDIVQDNINNWTVTGGRLTAAFEFSERWDAQFLWMTQKQESTGAWHSDPALGQDKIALFHMNDRLDDWDIAALTVRGDLGFAELTSVTSHVDRYIWYTLDNHVYDSYKTAGANSLYCTYYNYYCYYYNYYDLGVLYDVGDNIGYYFNDQTQKRFSQELRLTSLSDSRFRWMVGAYYEDVTDEWFYANHIPNLGETNAFAYANYWAYYYNYYYGYDIQYPLPDNELYWVQEYSRTVEQISAFANFEFDITDSWSVSLGGRWLRNERNRYERNTFPQEFPSWGTFDTNGEDIVNGQETEDTSIKVSTKFNINDDHMVYALYSEGFRLGGYNSLRASNAGFVDRQYNPDYMDNFEFGHKGSFFDNRLSVQTSIFHMKWTDIQLPRWNQNVWWQNGNLNGGAAEQTGAEVYITAVPTDNLRLTGNFAWGDGEYTEDIYSWDISTDPRTRVIDTPAGTEKPFSPEFAYSVGAEYTVPRDMFSGQVSLYYYINGQTDTYRNRGSAQDGIVDLPAWDVHNMTVRWANDDGMSVSLRVRNIFNERYRQALYTGNNWQIDSYWPNETRWRDEVTFNRPREISLQLRYDF